MDQPVVGRSGDRESWEAKKHDQVFSSTQKFPLPISVCIHCADKTRENAAAVSALGAAASHPRIKQKLVENSFWQGIEFTPQPSCEFGAEG